MNHFLTRQLREENALYACGGFFFLVVFSRDYSGSPADFVLL